MESAVMIRHTLLLFALAGSLTAVPVYIGTGKNSASKGIYDADFDPETGKLSVPKLAAEYQNPGFLAQHPSKPVLLAVGAPNQPFADGTSSVAAFAIGPDHGLKFLGEASTGGRGACHLAVDPAGNTVATANYGDGRISTIRLNENGVPEQTVSVISNEGSGPNKNRQEGPHAHGVYFMPEPFSCLLVPDLGLDKVLVYPFDAGTSKLGPPRPPIVTAPGSGPRHLAFSPDWQHLYVVGELDASVLAVNNGKDHFSSLGTVSTLPADFTGTNTSAEIEVSQDGRFVYVSNRGHDSIAVLRRDPESGTLTLIQHAPCGGKHPRHFKIAPGGKWLLCANMQSDSISVLPLDPATGKLGAPAATVFSPSPICVLFAR